MSYFKRFLFINKIEGLSYIILLFIVLPFKYYFSLPLAIKIIGSIHGAIFLLFLYRLYQLSTKIDIPFKESSLYLILSLIPFGSFYIDKIIYNNYLKPVISK